MLRIFRKVRQSFVDSINYGKPSSPVRKYLFYAVGEIFLVVLGILIALQINNWNQDRVNKKIEKKLLTELVENLSVNELRLEESIAEEIKTARSIEYVVETLENKRAYHDSLSYHFGRADYGAEVILTNTAFEAIKSRGFEIIYSDEIRQNIINLFDAEYGYMIALTVRLEDQFWPNRSLPLFHKHFRIKTMDKRTLGKIDFSAIPVNYEALLNDDEYINMIKHRGAFRYEGATLKEEVLQSTLELKKLVEEYLN